MYKIFGFDVDLKDFELNVDSFVKEIKLSKELEREMCVVFYKRLGR